MKIIRNPGECTPLSIQDELLQVDWTNLGEGLHGDYDPDDPEDVNLLRFDTCSCGKMEQQTIGSPLTTLPIARMCLRQPPPRHLKVH